MKPKTMVLILMAVTCGLGASFMTSRLLSERSSDEEKIDVLVAKKNLDTGLIMKRPEDLFEVKQKPKDEVPPKVISDIKELKGRMLKIPRRTGDMITQDELTDKDSPGIAQHLPDGYRAVGQRVDMQSTASGFAALPLSRVDIIHTVRRGNPRDSIAQVLLENVLVLAADTQTVRDDTGKAMPASIVTFALTPEDVLKLDLARSSGTISLALRKYGETARVGDLRTTEEKALNSRTSAAKSEDEAQEGVAANRNPGATGLPEVNLSKQPAFTEPPTKKERPFAMVIVQGGSRKRVEFPLAEDGQYQDPGEVRDNAEVNEEEGTPAPAAKKQQPKNK